MKKYWGAVGSIAGLAAMLLGLAVTMGWIGPPDRYRLGPETLAAMEAYHDLVAPIRTHQDARAARDRESDLGKRANDLASEYVRTVQKEGRPDRDWEKFVPAFKRFAEETKQYESLAGKSAKGKP